MTSDNNVTVGGIQRALKNIEDALTAENLDQLVHTRDAIRAFNMAFKPTNLDQVIGKLSPDYKIQDHGNPPVGRC